jgi:hypothetical protein
MKWNWLRDILPVLTLVIGYCGTIATERMRDRTERRRHQAAAVDEFERSVILETQDALYAFAGELQDFAFCLRGESDRSYASITDSAWRASARLEMLSTRMESPRARELVDDVLASGQAIIAGSWPDEGDWSDDDRALLDKAVDELLECEQRAATRLGDRLRALTYQRAA